MIQREISTQELISSLGVALLTLIFLIPLIQDAVIKPRLYDGTINELGRYSFTFDAYEYIADNSENAIIAIGSSKMREIFDGNLISEATNYSGDFFNLAYADDKPYIRMIEIDAILRLNPDLVVLEVGPNSFSSIPEPLDARSVQRMSQLMALNTEWETSSWKEIIFENDKEMLPLKRSEQILYLSSLTPKAIEKTFLYEFELEAKPFLCDRILGRVECVPEQDNIQYNYDEYLRYPTQFRNSLQFIKSGKESITIEEFYGPRLDTYINSTYHNSEGSVNKNQIAFEFIITSLVEQNIPVLLVGLPYNPVLIERLATGQWDYYNQSINNYEQINGVTVNDMIWSSDWIENDFNDFAHASKAGESKFAETISPIIDSIIED